jgi:amidase
MAQWNELAALDGTAQAELVRRGEIKAIELVEAAIERIESLNPVLNAVVTPMYEEARSAAGGVLPEGPFTGVPFLLKDLLAYHAGVPTTSGSRFLRDYVPDHDSELVARLKRAGLVTLGKTNLSEFGILPTTEPSLFGPTRNPWNTERTAGGSSGGSAAAVAAGLVSVAHAADGGGSIRIPASCCAVFGIKPTRARTPLGPDFGDVISGLVVQHALTRSVRDSAALLDITCSPDVGDPYWAPPPERPYLEEVGSDPGRLRIAFSTTAVTGAAVHPDCVKAVHDAAQLCVELGHEVEDASPSVDGELVTQAFITVWSAGVGWMVDGFALLSGKTPAPDQFEPLTWALYEMGRGSSASDYLLSLTLLQMVSRDIARFFNGFDAWLTPTVSEPPVPLGTFDSPPDNPMQGLLRAAEFVPFTGPFNFTGQPAMSVPLYWNDEGLPIGTQFVGRFGDEATLFRLAGQLEAARPWADRRPPLWR